MSAAAKIVDFGAGYAASELAIAYNVEGYRLSVMLFKNNITVAFATVLGDLTVCDFDGYAPIEIDDWGGGALVGESYELIGTIVRQWTIAGATNLPQTIYGYGLFVSSSLHYAESLASPIALTATGQIIQIQPRVLVGNCP